MVTRCVAALNELDKISQKISQKNSQKRLRAGTEAKLKLAKKKADEAFHECDTNVRISSAERNRLHAERNALQKKGPSSSTAPSNPLGNDKQKTSKARFSKSAVASLDRGQEQNAQRTKAWSSCSSKNISKRPETGTAASENTVAPRPVSTYGRHTDAESRYTPTAWFNFKEAKSVGVIDAFACDANNVRPLCYKVDKSQTKGVPRLLRHRLAVRVGQNGVVRNAGADTSNSVECGGDVDRAQEEPPRGGAQKQRVAPLSWEEQVNWKNVKCISQRGPSPTSQEQKGLCETKPVIFHPKARAEEPLKRARSSGDTSSATRRPAYRTYVETRTLSADRRNLVASRQENLFTEIGIEDARESEGVDTEEDEPKGHVCEMSGTLDEAKGDPSDVLSSEGEAREHLDKLMATDPIPLPVGKIPKKVSFDEVGREEHEEAVKLVEDLKIVDKDAVPKKKTLTRPRTSRERLLSTRDLEGDSSQRKRPYTAPPSTPRHHHDNVQEVCQSSVNHHATVIIPTSRLDSNDTENADTNNEYAEEHKNGRVARDKDSETLEENVFTDAESEETGKGRNQLRVRFAPMSAATRQAPHRNESAGRAKSATVHRQKAYSPPPPVVVTSDSMLELPKGLTPADALLSLRKKIREDLEQQNRDLQLDIQQLHLNRHSGNV